MKQVTFEVTLLIDANNLSKDDSEELSMAVLSYLHRGLKTDMADRTFPFTVTQVDVTDNDGNNLTVLFGSNRDYKTAKQ